MVWCLGRPVLEYRGTAAGEKNNDHSLLDLLCIPLWSRAELFVLTLNVLASSTLPFYALCTDAVCAYFYSVERLVCGVRCS